MSTKDFDYNEPIIIGLAGKAGSGKTSVAEQIVPKGSIETVIGGIKWDHIFYALPLYELASIKKTIKGFNEDNRQMYAIHDVLYDTYGRNPLGEIPDYESFVSKVRQIKSLFIEPEGIKPRSFLQKAGDICRDQAPDCFAKWAIYKSYAMHRAYLRSVEEDAALPYVVIISDVRFLNEAQSILSQKNGRLICFEASSDTLNQRLLKRDGKTMDPELAAHVSEQQIDSIKNIATTVINTDNMSIEQQTSATISSLGLGVQTNA